LPKWFFMLASTKPSSSGFSVKSSASRTRLVPSMSPDMACLCNQRGRKELLELERRLRLGAHGERTGRGKVFELRPFLREFVVDQRLVVETLAGGDLEQAIGELLRVGRARAHLGDEFRRRFPAAFLGLQHARDLLHAAPDGDVFVGRGPPTERKFLAR